MDFFLLGLGWVGGVKMGEMLNMKKHRLGFNLNQGGLKKGIEPER